MLMCRKFMTTVCPVLAAALFFSVAITCAHAAQDMDTIIVSAEGLADPDADIYQKDRGLLLDDLRADARRQVIEKAVGTMVESSTLVENYALVEDRIMTKSHGLIKQVIKESSPWRGDDGFMHILLKAEVFLGQVRDSVKGLSRSGRVEMLKQHGNPRIEVEIHVRDAQRGENNASERSFIAENILKEHFNRFGYRVWSQGEQGGGSADFAVQGEARFKQLSVRLRASGLVITKHVLTSWSVKCVNLHTGQEIYFNNQVPKNKSWADEDAALADIGAMVGQEFNRDFFAEHMMQPSKIFALNINGLPDYDVGLQVKKELIGLRHVLNVELREFNAEAQSLFEIDFSGSRDNFAAAVNTAIIEPLNKKLGYTAFRMLSARGEVVELGFNPELEREELDAAFTRTLPASLYNAAPGRIASLLKDSSTRDKINALAPGLIQDMESFAVPAVEKGSTQIRDF